ncbi:serine/threonine-protein kinase pakF isoform X5 [Helianthus annuus]|uniref:serine/threonine-protein kinase pakF isoform X5 n=1 Tax=Helianthus annuus TaxID=4232 RepID=UPI000B8FA862|nr:serine/threonine-protein kinase pakF isoform X5 [Helianthus annuus]
MSESGDGLDHLRIPYDKIKFGEKLETQGYGTVFEGEFNDQRVALKQLNITNLANIKPKLLGEILTISKFRQHPNLVALLGFCDEKSNEIILVYEYVASGNLEDKMRKRLTTIQRFEICLGAARGLCYLHTGVESLTIVHGNIKLSKILLNSLNSDANLRYEAKVSSFGLSKIVPGKGQKVLESSDEEGSKPTKESDVYSFGVLLLIVLCGVSELVDTDDYQERHVSELVPKKMKQNELRKTVHRDIRKEIKTEALDTYAAIACQCVLENPDERPDMVKVVEELEKALRLQGGEVTYVQIPGGGKLAGVIDEAGKEPEKENIPVIEEDVEDLNAGDKVDTAGEDDGEKNTGEATNTESSNNDQSITKEILNSKMESNEEENKSKIPTEDVYNEMSTIDPESIEDQTIDAFDSDNKSVIIEENNEDEKSIKVTSNDENYTMKDTNTKSVPDRNHIDDAKIENSIHDPATENEIVNNLNSIKESNTTVESEEENKSEIAIEDANNEMMIIDQETTDITTTSESSIGDTNTSTNQEGVPDKNHIEGAKNENSNDDPAAANDLNSINESNITVENEEEKKSEIVIKDAHNEMSKTDQETTEITTTSESSNDDKSTSTNQETVLDKNHAEDANNESSNNDPTTQKEILNDLNFIRESNITVENEEENKSKIAIKDAHNETSRIDQGTTEISTTSESSNVDTTTLTSQEVQESKILKSDRGSFSFSEVNEDELERLRIPLEEIKFGQKIDFRGYGTMFEGEYRHQQVALKRLNITNLHNIKPKLLSAILTIYRFRQHPNLVALIGFCDENNKEIILVYEYVSGGNLSDKMSKHLTAIQRLQICHGAARGLEYLHSDDVIHGNIRLPKILLKSDSDSSNFEAKVSGFGLPKLLPGQVEIVPKSMDPAYAATGKLTKESDVYSFGVLLLEVLCGVPELVDTDDYQERHVTELVPKRLEQNMLRKIVHFDIRDEITTESLETYARIACWCVMKNPEGRPTMPEVVVELEKALRLQGGNVSDVQIFGSGNGNRLSEVPVVEDDHKGDDNVETVSPNIIEEESKVTEETIDEKNKDVNLLGESLLEDAETKNVDNLNDPESTEETTVDQKSIEESKISVENEVSNESKITTPSSKSDNGDNSNSAMEDVVKENVKVPESTEEITVDPKSNEESKIIGESEVINECKITASFSSSAMQEPLPDEISATKEKGNGLMMNTSNPHIVEVKNSTIPDDSGKAGSLNTDKPDLIVNDRGGDFSNSATQIQESKIKRSNSTSSESSNGDDTAASDYLLPKSPDNAKKTTRGSGNCCYCCCYCSWWQFISDRVVLCGELFWNKLVSMFTWMTGQCSSKRD